MGGEGEGIVASGGVVELVRRLDRVAGCRPEGDPPLPRILCTGAGAGRFVRGFAARLVRRDRAAVVPHVLVEAEAERKAESTAGESQAEDVALLDRIANELTRSMPASFGRLRLTSYWMLRDVLDAEVAPARYDERRLALRDRLYTRHQDLRPFSRWLGQLADDPAPDRIAVLLRPLTLHLPRFVFGWRLAHGRRVRWFGETMSHVTGRGGDYLGAALCLVRGGPDRANAALVRRMLLLSLLDDLDHATGRSFVSARRRRRVTPFVLLFTGVALDDAHDPAGRFLDTLASVDDPSRRGTTLVLAAVGETGNADEVGLPEAAAALDNVIEADADHADDDDLRQLVVHVPDDDGGDEHRDEAGAEWLAVHQRVRPPTGRLVRAVPLATLGTAALVVLLGAAGGVALLLGGGGDGPGPGPSDRAASDGVGGPPPGRCPQIRTAEGTTELIGVGDGTLSCSFFPERPEADDREQELDEKNQAVERTIAQANDEVVKGAAVDPYRTVVFFAPLTVPYGPERYGQTGLRQLRGIALAQEEANRRARNDRAEVPLRVVLANPGDRFAHGPAVARQIVDLARTDGTVVGVVGIAQSRASSREAIGILGEAGLPVVAGPVTGDAMVDEALSDSYYQVSPRNDRIAAALADFATSVPIVGPAGDGATAADAVIILDPDDEYSQNLADDFEESFTATSGHATTRFPYSVDDSAASLEDIARRTCAALDGDRDIVFFASRSQQLTGLLDNLADSDCGAGVTVVAGSDITKLVQDPLVELGRYDFLRLYYASFGFASPDLAADPRLSRATTGFVLEYRERYPPGTSTFDIGDAALTFDAFRALQEAVDHAATRVAEPTGPDVAESLAAGVVEFEGASGHVTFDQPDGSVGRVPRDKLMLVIEVHGRRRSIQLLCGRLSESTVVDTWGADERPCPRDR